MAGSMVKSVSTRKAVLNRYSALAIWFSFAHPISAGSFAWWPATEPTHTDDNLCLARRKPCTLSQLGSEDQSCVRRIVPCGSHAMKENNGTVVLYLQHRGYDPHIITLGGVDGREDRTCRELDVDPYSTTHYLVRFAPSRTMKFYAPSTCWEILMRAGECWLSSPSAKSSALGDPKSQTTGASYTSDDSFPDYKPSDDDDVDENRELGSCLGRCGSGCSNGYACSNYGGDCLRDDVCHYFFGEDCDIDGADSDWKHFCIFGGQGKCESKMTAYSAHTEENICGGNNMKKCDEKKMDDFFIPYEVYGLVNNRVHEQNMRYQSGKDKDRTSRSSSLTTSKGSSSSDNGNNGELNSISTAESPHLEHFMPCTDQGLFDKLVCDKNNGCCKDTYCCDQSSLSIDEKTSCTKPWLNPCGRLQEMFPFCRCRAWAETQLTWV